MVATRAEFTSWKPSEWRDTGESLKEFAKSIEDAGTDFESAINTAGGSWEGAGFDGAQERASTDIGEIDEVAGKLKDAGEALSSAGSFIEPIHTYIMDTLLPSLESTYYTVDDDWTVTDVYPYTPDEEWMKPEREAFANKNTGELRSEVGRCTDVDSTHGQDVTSALSGLNGLVTTYGSPNIDPTSSSTSTSADELTAEQGREDAEAIMNGTATDEQRERFRKASDLSEEDAAALANGEKVKLPPGQIDYLREVINHVDSATDGSSLEKLEAAANFGGDDQSIKDAYADAVRIISNPQITNGYEDLPPQLRNAEGLQEFQGGIDKLPESYKEALLGAPMHLDGEGPTGDTIENGTVVYSAIPQLDQIRDIMKNGSESTRSGSDVNRLMLERTSEIAEHVNGKDKSSFVISENTTNIPNDFGGYDSVEFNDKISYDEMRERLNSYVDVAGKDEVAFHDFLVTGQPEERGFGDPISGMPGKSYRVPETWPYDLGSNYEMSDKDSRDPDRALNNLLTFDWNEENGGDSGMRNTLAGMGEPSRVFGTDRVPGPGAEVSGRSAQVVAEYLGNNKDDLLDLPNHGNTSLGILNPGVVEGAADGIGPHLIGLAGGGEENGATYGTGAMDSSKQMTNMFAVLDSSEGSATSINTWGSVANQGLQEQYAMNAEVLPNGQVDGGGIGEVSARITNSMQDGLTLAANDLTHDEREDIANEYYQKGLVYDTARTGIKEAVGFIPGVGSYIKPFVDVTGVALKGEIIGPPEYLGDHEAEDAVILENAQGPKVYAVQPRSTENLISFVNATPDLSALAQTDIENTNLARFLDDNGQVDLNTLQTDADLREFRSAAEAVLGDLDDSWERDTDTATVEGDWNGTYNQRPK